MAFRADEEAKKGYDRAFNYLIPKPRDAGDFDIEQGKLALSDLIEKHGPVVESYPTWHPLVSHTDSRISVTCPGQQCGYQGLDHTVLFANAFVTCPYGDGQNVIDSVNRLPAKSAGYISAEKLNFKLYNAQATAILVRFTWDTPLLNDGTIPLSVALPLLLEKELPCWKWSQVGETWESMRPDFLGKPHGSRSSLFINQETGQAIKKIWNELIYSGMFGPIKVFK